MRVGISSEVAAAWLRQPILRGLLLSAGLHFAFIVLFQTEPDSDQGRTVVINARLLAAPRPPLVKEEVGEATDDASAAAAHAESRTDLLTAMTPSLALPIEQAVVPQGESVPPLAPELLPTPPAPSEARNVPVEPPPGAQRETGLPSLPLDIDTNWYLARQVDVHPKAIGKIEPAYPEEAKRSNIEGTLKLMLKIDDLGRVQSVEVVEAIPPGVFDAAAVAAFVSARFHPALKDGRPVRYQAYMRVDFKLKD
jgi:periplasmic protein TonB